MHNIFRLWSVLITCTVTLPDFSWQIAPYQQTALAPICLARKVRSLLVVSIRETHRTDLRVSNPRTIAYVPFEMPFESSKSPRGWAHLSIFHSRSSGMWCLRMWCLIIIDFTLSYSYILPNMGSQNHYYQTPHPQTPHP